MYYNDDPCDWIDHSASDDFAAELRAHPYGFRTLKYSFPLPDEEPTGRRGAGCRARVLPAAGGRAR